VTELKPKAGFYDYDAKYTDGLTEHVCPAEVPGRDRRGDDGHGARGAPAARLQGRVALRFPLGRRAGRGGLYLLEVNTQPGMTPLSLVPEQALSRHELASGIVEEAMATRRSGSMPCPTCRF
jgi:D-alanine-D-alanine ligase